MPLFNLFTGLAGTAVRAFSARTIIPSFKGSGLAGRFIESIRSPLVNLQNQMPEFGCGPGCGASLSPKQFGWQDSPVPTGAMTGVKQVWQQGNSIVNQSGVLKFGRWIWRNTFFARLGDGMTAQEAALQDYKYVRAKQETEFARQDLENQAAERENNSKDRQNANENKIGGVSVTEYNRIYQQLYRKRIKESEAYKILVRKRNADKQTRAAAGITPINGERVRGLYAVLGGTTVTAEGIAASPQFRKQISDQRAIGK